MTKARALALQSGLNLPHRVMTLSGAVFDPRAKRWAFHDGLHAVSINFERLSVCATEGLVEAMKFPLVWYAENAEAATVETIFESLRWVLKRIAAAQERPVSVIDTSLLANLRASLTPNTEWKLGVLSAFLKKWNSLGVPGVTDDAARFLKSIRLKGNFKGTAVLTMDPRTGPLTDVERAAVQTSLNAAFSAGIIGAGQVFVSITNT